MLNQAQRTTYVQKVSYDIYGISDHRDESGHLYLLNETTGPQNTDHSFSYIMHYLKSLGRFPAGSIESMFLWIMPAQLKKSIHD